MTKAAADLDSWAKDVAPSTELRVWYGHEPSKFDEFRRRYLSEFADLTGLPQSTGYVNWLCRPAHPADSNAQRRPQPGGGLGRGAARHEPSERMTAQTSGTTRPLSAVTSGEEVRNASNSRRTFPLPRTGPSRRCWLQSTTKVRLCSSSRAATPIAPSASTSSISPSPRNAHTCMTLFTQMGFDPTTARGHGNRINLRSCQFRELAEAHPAVVCTLHLGLLRELVERRSAGTLNATLHRSCTPGCASFDLAATTEPATA